MTEVDADGKCLQELLGKLFVLVIHNDLLFDCELLYVMSPFTVCIKNVGLVDVNYTCFEAKRHTV